MAAAIIPLVVAAVSAIGPQIPAIVQMVEGLFGHSSTTGTQDGATKMAAAVAALTSLLQSYANAGKIPSASVVDPSLAAGLTGAIQQVVDQLNAAGKLNGSTSAPTAPISATTPVLPSPVTPGTKVAVSGTLVFG